MDLKPRELAEAKAGARRKRRWGPLLLLAGVLVAGGIVVTKFLTSAIDYYCNADEIGVKASCSGERRLRVQGIVDQHSIVEAPNGGVASFTITFNDRSVPVDYAGGAALPDLFQACIPVVVEGRLRDGELIGTNVEVKHTSNYEADNPGRVTGAEEESAACSQRA